MFSTMLRVKTPRFEKARYTSVCFPLISFIQENINFENIGLLHIFWKVKT